jgi:AAA+ superfamily predicted ATPase
MKEICISKFHNVWELGNMIVPPNKNNNLLSTNYSDFYTFFSRFNSIIEFENPELTERLQLLENYIPVFIKTDKRISLKEIARKYDLTGANRMKVY